MAKALSTTRQVKIIDKKKFAKAVLDEIIEAFIVHVALLTLKMLMHPTRKAQIALLVTKKVTIPAEYSDYADLFSKKLAVTLPERSNINEYAINREYDKQPLYGPIYSLGPVKLKTLKTYIKTNLANSFIYPYKSRAGAPILFVQKPNSSLHLYVNY